MVAAELAAFSRLSAHEQHIVGLVSAFHGPLNRTRLAELLTFAGVRKERGRLYGPPDAGALMAGWCDVGLLEATHNGYQGLYRVPAHLTHPLLELLLQRGTLRTLAETVRGYSPLRGRYNFTSTEALSRELVLGLYLRDGELTPQALCEMASTYDRALLPGPFLQRALGAHVPAALLQRLDPALCEPLLVTLFEEAILSLVPVGEGPVTYATEQPLLGSEARAWTAAYLALRGQPADALLAGLDDVHGCAARCLLALTRGALVEARAEAKLCIEHTRTRTSKKLKGYKSWLGNFAVLALITDADTSSIALGREQLSAIKRPPPLQFGLHDALLVLASAAEGNGHAGLYVKDHLRVVQRWDELLLWGIAANVVECKPDASFAELADKLADQATDEGFVWIGSELSSLQTPETRSGLLALHQVEEPWMRALRTLEGAVSSVEREQVSDGKISAQRLVWTLAVGAAGEHTVAARVQTSTAAGWSGGRQISWKKLFEAGRDAPWFSEEEVVPLEHVRPPNAREYELSFAPDAQLPVALIGHPRVFSDPECRQPVEVQRGAVRLEVNAEPEHITVALSPAACHQRDVVCVHEGSRILVYTLTPAQRAIAQQLGDRGLKLPPHAREAAQRVLARLVAHFPISSQIGIDAANLEEVAADARIHVGLSRTQTGLRVRTFVSPIGPSQSFAPGEGSESVLGALTSEQGTRTVRATRDLIEERRRYDALIDACPSLGALDHGPRELRVDDLEQCLELLSELRRAPDVVLAWTEGAPLELAGERQLRDVRLRLSAADTWFAADGEIEVDQGLKLTFQALLNANQRKGRFVLLDDGRYLALTDDLTRTLDTLAPLARHDKRGIDLHPLALLQLSQLAATQVSGDQGATDRLTRIREAGDLQPAVPSAFQATLRPYQEEGFAWLSRLAHWGAGACLADDMGLGKTLQTLALLVEQADKGPSLVVAPTSVCENWLTEARRFAPTLRVIRLGNEREKTLRELQPRDVLVCSYGLLQQEIERLEQLSFQVLVLDEAQAIKNLTAQRTRAALRLQGAVRVALTGTPVENHLGELYSVMRFLNPGLLGTSKQFEERFAKPIQRDGDRTSSQLLKRLVRPFILRRRKSEVLDDLPEKTVITLRIEPSAEEQALYAALRDQALTKVVTPTGPADARIRILAELMKLRRAACHPQLAVPGTQLASSKLAAFEELVHELREGGHRTLVFSQFVDHLAIVRARLDELGIGYQYLDGSSSPQARAQAVDAFQAGRGDLFLISLKAGGFGLNLTAADYVVHLDPWWNPAVEDQASDRAHRIGQTRPVTVYRLVMQGSIEERILALHAAKRDLADALLEGNTSAAALSVDDLVALVREAASEMPRARSVQPEAN